ncbi:MAG: hypothetical protein ACR2O0_06975 [Rhizobiaceae bacterium]
MEWILGSRLRRSEDDDGGVAMHSIAEIYIHSPIWLKTLMVLLPFVTTLAALKMVLSYRLALKTQQSATRPASSTYLDLGDEPLTIRSPEVARRLEHLAKNYRFKGRE